MFPEKRKQKIQGRLSSGDWIEGWLAAIYVSQLGRPARSDVDMSALEIVTVSNMHCSRAVVHEPFPVRFDRASNIPKSRFLAVRLERHAELLLRGADDKACAQIMWPGSS